MQDRIRNHIRSNVVGYVALFFALSLGTAWASHPGGENTISSADIIDGAVRNPDLRNGVVNSAKVTNESLTGEDIAPSSLTASELATGSVHSDEVAENSLGRFHLAAGSVGSSELGANSVSSVKVTDESLMGFDIAHDSVTGTEIDELTLSVEAMGCQIGVIHGFARIHNAGSLPPQFTSGSRIIDRAYNCAGGEISVRRRNTGRYD